MKLIRTTGLIMLMTLITAGLFAQQRGQGRQRLSPDQQADQQLEQLKKVVKVNAKESKQIREVFLNAASKRQKAFEEMRNQGDRTGMRDLMLRLNTERDKELKEILGEVRMDKYLKEMEKQRQQRQQRGDRQRRF